MAAKKTKATAAANSAAPAVDQAGDVSTSSAVGPEAGTAPAAGVVNESTQGAGDAGGESGGAEPGADPAAAGESSDQGAGAGEGVAGEGESGGESGDASEGAGGEVGDTAESTISGESGNAPTLQDANAPTSESANAQAGAGDTGDGLETAQTPAENGPASPVILGAWSLPAIGEYPATLTLTNHTPSRFVALGKGIPVDGSIQLEVTEQEYSKLAKSLRGAAQLDKWDNVRGLQVAYDPQN